MTDSLKSKEGKMKIQLMNTTFALLLLYKRTCSVKIAPKCGAPIERANRKPEITRAHSLR